MPEFVALIETAIGESVSRETVERLDTHLALLRKWNPTINLVSPASLEGGGIRHIVDSAQLLGSCSKSESSWLDFGSGGGFPGLVCAIIAKQSIPDMSFTLVESDKRKSAFLMNAARTLDLDIKVIAKRVEELQPANADIVSARAVASLTKLLSYATPHLGSAGKCFFPKGARFRDEIREAQQHWRFKLSQKPSITDENSAILVLGEIARV